MNLPFVVSCASIALRDRPVAEAIDRIADAGFDGIEFLFPHLEKMDRAGLQAVSAQCRERDLTPTVLSPYFSFTRGEEWRGQSLEAARRALEIAEILGIKKVRTFIDIGSDGLPSVRAQEADWQAARDGLRELCALDPATEFVVETHENTLADSLPGVQRLFAEVDRPNLRLNFQANRDFLQRGYLESLKQLFPLVGHFHWQQHDGLGGETYLEEKGVIDFPGVIAWLAEHHYRGTASVEYCWRPVDETRLATATRYLSGIAAHLPA